MAPEAPAPGRAPADEVVVSFAGAVRAAGIDVPAGTTVELVRAVAVLDGTGRSLYWAGRATLVHRPEDVPAYDRAFASFWGAVPGAAPGARGPARREPATEAGRAGAPAPDPGEHDDERPPTVVPYSRAEVLRHMDLAACTDDELEEVRRLMARLRIRTELRRSRRHVAATGARGRPDPGRTMRRSLRAGGQPVPWTRRERSSRPRRLVLLLDVSGSMAPYARALVRFAHGAVTAGPAVEVFALGTRLTRLTRELSARQADAALARAGAAVADWGGGTRLGEVIGRFNDEWGCRGLARGASVVVLSDGWDRGDPELLAEQMARLARVAHRIVWVNPLKASPGYAPLARGMAAALPHVDLFVEGHSLASLEGLAAVLESGDER